MSSEKLKPSEALRLLRKEQGWSQRRFALELRKTTTTVRRWEYGIHKPSPEVCEKLAALANNPDLVDYFIEMAGLQSPPQRKVLPKEISLPTALARAQSIALRAIQILTEQAAAGSDYAFTELNRYADELMERAAHASSLEAHPEVQLQKKISRQAPAISGRKQR